MLSVRRVKADSADVYCEDPGILEGEPTCGLWWSLEATMECHCHSGTVMAFQSEKTKTSIILKVKKDY